MYRNTSISAFSLLLCLAGSLHAQMEGAPVKSATRNDAQAIDMRVSPMGILTLNLKPLEYRSPLGRQQLRVVPIEGGFHHMDVQLEVRVDGGATHVLPRVRGNGFLATDFQRIVVIDGAEAGPSRLSVIDLEGQQVFGRDVLALSDVGISNAGRVLAWRSMEGISTLDLDQLRLANFPNRAEFAARPDGVLLGTLVEDPRQIVLDDPRGTRRLARLEAPVRKLAFSLDGSLGFALTERHLHVLDLSSGATRTAYSSPTDGDLRDLRVNSRGVHVGLRRRSADSISGWLISFGPAARSIMASSGPIVGPPPAQRSPGLLDTIPWPLSPNAQHPIGNTYGEYQNYGGSPYPHPGIDVLGSDNQPVYAVKGGVVKAVLTTSGDYHWRMAIADVGGSGTSEGFLYAHLDQPTIAFSVGDTVLEGDYIGNLVPWPVAGFTHTHFARIEDSGSQWFGNWLCTENSHLRLEQQSETQAPFFLNAVGSNLFAFCNNDSSNYQNPNSLSGSVDIIARIGDQIGASWVCSVQEIRYSIYPVDAPNSPIVDDKLAVRFDMEIDLYAGGPNSAFLVDLFYKQDSTCWTEGDYSSREFYHIITNSNGDNDYTPSDVGQAWDTSLLSNGDYVIAVTAKDAAGNATTALMTVSTSN